MFGIFLDKQQIQPLNDYLRSNIGSEIISNEFY